MSFITEPLQFEFFRHALAAAVMVGILCGLMGVFITLRGQSYIGHGLSHAAFGGAVVGYLLNVNFYVAAAGAAILAALVIQRIHDGRRVRSDAAIGIVSTVFFAVGVALISAQGKFERSFEAALFGNILGVSTIDLAVIGGVTLLCGVFVVINYRGLFALGFDDDTAAVLGVKIGRLQLWLSIVLALCIIAAMNIVGVTMIAAALVVPAATARMLTDSYNRLFLASPVIGAVMGAIGMFLSYHFDAASGATIVITGGVIFSTAWALRSYRHRFATHAHVHKHGANRHAHPHDHKGDHAHSHDKHHAHPHEHDGIVHAHPHDDEHKH